ncbi:MAG: tagaturonate reductase [Gemmatimonadaceae bacterium]
MASGSSTGPTLTRALVSSPALRDRARTIDLPAAGMMDLPERAIQFGTGALLRGLVDYCIDDANRRGLFGGRVVMVGSTGSGRDERLNEQNGLFTLVVQGLVEGTPRRDCRVVASVSRALAATTQWADVLRAAESPALELIFSNTTEVGIVLDEEDASAGASRAVPRSFPAKLTRLLHHRARHVAFDATRAPVVIPCELIEHNGVKLKAIVRALAERWMLEPAFLRWLEDVPFCNTLVDRIVPGAPSADEARELEALLGYDDAMLTVCEPYRLFAIEGDAALRDRLRFATADEGIVIAPDIAPYRERKVRLLNGAHTSFVSLALLAGCTTVREAVEHPLLGPFLRTVLFEEIVPSVSVPGAAEFAREVLDRFANPYLHHALWDITLQGTAKLRVRLVPTILAYAARTGQPPRALSLGFAGYLAFQRGELQEARRASGASVPADASAGRVADAWRDVGDDSAGLALVVRRVCADAELWGTDLTAVPGFADAVTEHLWRIRHEGVAAALGTFTGVTA